MKSLKEFLKEDYSNNPLTNMDLRTSQDAFEECLKGLKVALESEHDADRVYDDLENMGHGILDINLKEEFINLVRHIRSQELEHISEIMEFIKKNSSQQDKIDYMKGEQEDL